MTRRAILPVCAALAACASDPGALGPDGELVATPSSVTCEAGDVVSLAATVGGRRATTTFTVRGDAVWLDAVRRTDGTASLACEAEGQGVVEVEAAGRHAFVAATVRPTAASGVRVTMTPGSIALVTGTTAWVDARATVARPRASTEVRYRSADTTVAVVDSMFGLVRATGPGTTSIVAAARANRSVTATTSVVVTRSSSLVTAIFPSVSFLNLRVGDSVRVSAGIQFTQGAPPGTSRALGFESVDPDVVTVSPNGVLRAVGQGTGAIFLWPVVAPLLRARVLVFVSVPPP